MTQDGTESPAGGDAPRGGAPGGGPSHRLRWSLAVLVVVALSVGLVLAREIRLGGERARRAEEAARGPRVLVAPVQRGSATREIELPVTIHGYVETPIYAKISGYLKEIAVDKGDRVRKGALLARIEAPELDKQVADAKANLWLQRRTDERNQRLVREDAVAHQAADASHAALLEAEATYEQLLVTQAYERITAPFDGVVTARYVDPGVLVPQSTSSTSGNATAIVSMATLAPVRVYADVPQDLALFVRDGDPAVVSVAPYPGRKFEGRVTRHPSALAPDTRTMRVEVDLPNDDEALYPGMYGQVSLQVSGRPAPPRVPDDALVFRNGKTYVPIVAEGRVRLVEVVLGADDGREVEITRGVSEGDLVAINLGQAVHDGEPVQPIRESDLAK